MSMEIGVPSARRRAPGLPAEAQACQHCSSQHRLGSAASCCFPAASFLLFCAGISRQSLFQSCQPRLSLAADNLPIGVSLQHQISKGRLPEADPVFNRQKAVPYAERVLLPIDASLTGKNVGTIVHCTRRRSLY
jgi:hypothetical protein